MQVPTSVYELRKELHQHPELSGSEVNTASRIHSFVMKHHPTEIITGLGGNGMAVVYRFAEEGPTVVIRCELDALPIEEVNDFSYRSGHPGVSHKCGHDGHMATVAGLVKEPIVSKRKGGSFIPTCRRKRSGSTSRFAG
jgi:metal-dependent amidase/aminoacylase/carboxypeptidase family protein